MIYPCGCVNELDSVWGVMKNISKCESHKRHAGRGGRAYYEEIGAIKDGIPQHKHYIQELHDALEGLDVSFVPFKSEICCEIGAGCGMYAPLAMSLGYTYSAIEIDKWAASFIENTFDVVVSQLPYELLICEGIELFIAAHVLEHFKDAPTMLQKIHGELIKGGQVLIIVPDDEDPVNPDHLWFFNEESLTRVLKQIGFKCVVTVVKRIVKHENFIYCVASK